MKKQGFTFLIKKRAISNFILMVSVMLSIGGLSEAFAVVENPPIPPLPAPYVVVDTGQKQCYNNAQVIPCPQIGADFFGQDGQHPGVQPNYKDNNDGTVTDLNTGLMWQKNIGPKVTYEQAVADAATFNLAGHSDWRVPTIKELYSLIDFNGTDPCPGPNCTNLRPFINMTYFDFKYGNVNAGERIIDAQYWSSTEYVGVTMNNDDSVFGVNFADGRIKAYPKAIPNIGENNMFIRYVRGNPNYGKNEFIDNNDGTITDKATGLMWSKDDSEQGMNWHDALAWVQQKNIENYLGHNDWRLPNAKELQSVVDYTRAPSVTDSAAIDPIFNISSIVDEAEELNYPFYWTSTTHANAAGLGLDAVYLCFGEALGYMRTPDNNILLTDVHGAGAQRSDPKIGDPEDFPQGRGPQGDVVRINNFIRLVRSDMPIQEGKPEIQVLIGLNEIADNTGVVIFGQTSLNKPVNIIFAVKNVGNGQLILTPPITVPSGFTVIKGFGATALAPGALTSFTVQLDAKLKGDYSGQLSFATNDDDENPFNFTISGKTIDQILGGVAGRVWNDQNGDGRPAMVEKGLSGWQIYADLNKNSQFDPNEPNALTDPMGRYKLILPMGDYAIKAIAQNGWQQTFPKVGAHVVSIRSQKLINLKDFGFKAL